MATRRMATRRQFLAGVTGTAMLGFFGAKPRTGADPDTHLDRGAAV